MNNLIAQKEIPLGDLLKGIGPLGLEGKDTQLAPFIFNKFISSAIGLMTAIAAIWFIFLLIIGAYGIMSSGGDKQALESARKKITMGLVGLIVVVAGIFVIKLIGSLMGINFILNPLDPIIRSAPR